jgi:hypothetical protein
MAVGAIVARILTQYSDKGSKAAQKDIAKLGKNIDFFAKKSARAFGLAALASAAALAKISKDSIMAASDLSQQFGALDAVFGSNSEQLKTFSKSMVDYGLSTADAARYAALLGTQLKGLGLEEQDAIARTQKLQILAADLAATYGGTTADAVAALSSTFKGEYNPIERYGVAIRKSDITARVAAKGLGKLTGDALKAAEAQEAYALILAKTTAAQGQSRREYDTFAAQLQRVNATYENMKATLGSALLPVMEKFAAVLITKVLPQIEQFVNANKNQLAASFAVAAEFAVKFLNVAIAFGNWVANNTGTVKTLAVIIAGMFVAGRISAFIIMLGSLTTAMALLRTTAAGAAVATAFATGGVSVGTALTALGGLVALGLTTKNLFDMANGKAPAKGSTTGGGGFTDSQNAARLSGIGKITPTKDPVVTALFKNTFALNKNTKSIMDIATANAMKELATRQKALSGGSSIAIGGGSKIYSTRNDQGKIDVNVYAGNVVGSADALIEVVQNGLEATGRRNGVPRGALAPGFLIA